MCVSTWPSTCREVWRHVPQEKFNCRLSEITSGTFAVDHKIYLVRRFDMKLEIPKNTCLTLKKQTQLAIPIPLICSSLYIESNNLC